MQWFLLTFKSVQWNSSTCNYFNENYWAELPSSSVRFSISNLQNSSWDLLRFKIVWRKSIVPPPPPPSTHNDCVRGYSIPPGRARTRTARSGGSSALPCRLPLELRTCAAYFQQLGYFQWSKHVCLLIEKDSARRVRKDRNIGKCGDLRICACVFQCLLSLLCLLLWLCHWWKPDQLPSTRSKHGKEIAILATSSTSQTMRDASKTRSVFLTWNICVSLLL